MSQLLDPTQMDQHKQGLPVQDAMANIDLTSSPHFEQGEPACEQPSQLANNQDAVQDSIPPFMKTPLEIRNQIYGYLLSTKQTKVDFKDEEPGYIPGDSSRARRVYNFHPAILAVNHQINFEASQTLRQNLFVKLTTNAPVDYGVNLTGTYHGLPVVAVDESAGFITYSAIELIWTLGPESRDFHPSVLMFAGDDMVTFCRVLLRSWQLGNGQQNSMMIDIPGIAPTPASILNLLEPFRRLYSIATVRITGQIQSEYKSILITNMSRRKPAVDLIIQGVRDTIKEGNQAASIDDFSTAILKFRRGWEDSADRNWRCPFHAAFRQIEYDLESKLAETYLKFENYSRAHGWIALAIKRTTLDNGKFGAWSTSAGCAGIYSIAAQASEGLGMIEQAVEEMEQAMRYNPRDSRLATELERLKKKT